jgi:hypothetical protein
LIRSNLQIATFISAVIMTCTIILWFATLSMSPWDHRLSFTKQFHVSVWSRVDGDALGALVFFNNADYGPYRGSIMDIVNDKFPPISRGWSIGCYGYCHRTDFGGRGTVYMQERACDLPGIYFRYFNWPNKPQHLWTLAVSLWYPLTVFSVLPAMWGIRRWQSQKKLGCFRVT